MEEEIPEQLISDVITRVVAIQKRFAHVLQGVRTERRNEVRTVLSALVAEHLEQ